MMCLAMLEISFELLCTSLSLVRYGDKIPPSVNYTLLCAGIKSLNHNEYKTMNVIQSYNDKNIGYALLEFQLESIHTRTDVYETVVLSL